MAHLPVTNNPPKGVDSPPAYNASNQAHVQGQGQSYGAILPTPPGYPQQGPRPVLVQPGAVMRYGPPAGYQQSAYGVDSPPAYNASNQAHVQGQGQSYGAILPTPPGYPQQGPRPVLVQPGAVMRYGRYLGRNGYGPPAGYQQSAYGVDSPPAYNASNQSHVQGQGQSYGAILPTPPGYPQQGPWPVLVQPGAVAIPEQPYADVRILWDLSIVSVFFCLFIGIFSITHNISARNMKLMGQYQTALVKAKLANSLAKIAIIIGTVVIVAIVLGICGFDRCTRNNMFQ